MIVVPVKLRLNHVLVYSQSDFEGTCSHISLGKHSQITFLRTFGSRRPPTGAFRDKLRVSMVPRGQSYRKPYDSRFDHHPYPQGTRILKFAKFSGDQGKNTREHIGQFLAQLGELVDTEAFHFRLFSLSLTRTAFAWYTTLPPNSILSWGELKQKFYDHFFSGDYELDLVDLVALRQGKDESVNEYIQRFRDTRNRCFQIHLAEKQLAGLAFNGL
jgi:hypothetical protein